MLDSSRRCAFPGLYPDRETMLEDLNADREFRAQLVKVVTQRAVQQPGEAWIR